MQNINIIPTAQKKPKQDEKKLGFGKYFSDHMFLMDYTEGKGWHDARIVPYGKIELDPATVVLHYAQETFEGMKAYRTKEGKVLLFRPEKNGERLNLSNERLCIPQIPVDLFLKAVNELVAYEKDWVPSEPGTSLYIRPFVFANEVAVGVHPAVSYLFMIILSPVGSYYPNGIDPVRIYVEEEYVRAVKGGTGYTKCGGNYAASISAQKKAQELGYTQVLWLDGVERKYVEEVGTMNIMFKIGGEIITPPLEGSVLAGITRDSCITLLKEWGYKISERQISIDEVMSAARCGKLEEVFGTGTAAVVSPVGELFYKGETATIGKGEIGEVTQRLFDTLTGIQWGDIEDTRGWTREVGQTVFG